MTTACTRAERIACSPCLAGSRGTFELWCARYVASLPPDHRRAIDAQIPDAIKTLAAQETR